jgi:hypothetical protein
VLPVKSSVGTAQELSCKSLLNVGLTRSLEVLVIGMNPTKPSPYLAQVSGQGAEGVQLAWDESTVDASGPCRAVGGLSWDVHAW